jgi:hypothetical protein
VIETLGALDGSFRPGGPDQNGAGG